MRPRSRRLAPWYRNHQAAPLRPSGGGARGPGADCGEPPLPPTPPPPPSPWAAGGRLEKRRPRTPLGGPLHPGGQRHSRAERGRAQSAPGRPPAHSRITCCRPAALRRRRGPQRNGGTQECADEAARLGARLGKAGEQTVARRPLPAPTGRNTDPPAANRAAPGAHDRPATRAKRVYPRGCTGEEGGQRRGPRATPQGRGVGNSGAAPPPPSPPLTPPACEPRGRLPAALPEAGEALPPPRRDRHARGGTQLDPHTACPRAPHRLLPRGSRQAGTPAPARTNDAKATPGGGTRQQTRAVWGPRPP